MESKWKIIIGVVVAALIAILIIYMQIGAKTPQPQQPSIQKPPAAAEEKISEVAPPAATGNVDDSINALLQDSSLETTAAAEENSDTNLLSADAQVISDFGQSYEASEF